jgi:hypothetical protein
LSFHWWQIISINSLLIIAFHGDKDTEELSVEAIAVAELK